MVNMFIQESDMGNVVIVIRDDNPIDLLVYRRET